MVTTSNATGRLRAHWAAVAPRGPASEACLDALLVRYAEPHRRYHGISHVDRVVSDVVVLLGDAAVADAGAVRMSAFFHDAVYDPRSASNEVDSANLAARELAVLGWSEQRIGQVERLIMLTRDHPPSTGDEPGGDVLLHADLAVLGAPANVYQAYASGVRGEYSHVAECDWRVGRAAVLQHFLDQPHIYRTRTMARHEPRARANLSAELAELRSP